MRRGELVRWLERLPTFPRPRPELEQVVTTAEAAATLLQTADRRDGLRGRSVLDLGCGTGRLALGAAELGAAPVVGVDADPSAVSIAQGTAMALGLGVVFEVGRVEVWRQPAELVIMNPPFGAQTRHADRPFWQAAFSLARRSVYAFSLAASRTFIARWAVEQGAQVVEIVPVPWVLARSFPHHRRAAVELEVDLWAIRTAGEERGPGAT